MIRGEDRAVISKAARGATLSDDEMTDLYCVAPDILEHLDRAHGILMTIAEGAMTGEQAAFLARRHLGL